MKFKSNEEGRCPICNSENLEYFGMELMDNAIYYPWHCLDCDTEGKEWYYVNFSEVTAYTSGGDMSGYEEGICPECGGEIDYGTAEPDGNSLGYDYFCNSCGGSGKEWYDLDFDSHTIDGHESEDIVMEGKQLTEADVEKTFKEHNISLEAVKTESISDEEIDNLGKNIADYYKALNNAKAEKINLDASLCDELTKAIKLDFSKADMDILRLMYRRLEDLVSQIYDTKKDNNTASTIKGILSKAGVIVKNLPETKSVNEAFNLALVVRNIVGEKLEDTFGFDHYYDYKYDNIESEE